MILQSNSPIASTDSLIFKPAFLRWFLLDLKHILVFHFIEDILDILLGHGHLAIFPFVHDLVPNLGSEVHPQLLGLLGVYETVGDGQNLLALSLVPLPGIEIFGAVVQIKYFLHHHEVNVSSHLLSFQLVKFPQLGGILNLEVLVLIFLDLFSTMLLSWAQLVALVFWILGLKWFLRRLVIRTLRS